MIILDNLPKIWAYRFCSYGHGKINAYRASRQQAIASQLSRERNMFGAFFDFRHGYWRTYVMFAGPKGFLP